MDNPAGATLANRARELLAKARGESGVPLLVIAVALCLLPFLAFLQYRWIGQLSDAERERTGNNLRRALMQMRNDVDRTVTRAYEAFLLEPRGGVPESLEERAARYVAWLEGTQHRSLVRQFLISDSPEQGEPKLYSFDPQKMAFATTEWTKPLEEYRDATLRGIIHRSGATIAAPRFCPAGADQPRPENWRQNRVCGWAIAELNLDYAATQMLPPLIERYLGTDYFVEVSAEGASSKPLFNSSNVPIEKPDHVETMLQPRPDLLFRDAQRIRAARDSQILPSRGPFRTGDKRGQGQASQMRPGLLQVSVKHHSGSVEAAAERTRRLNLLISLGILGMLAGCVVLLHRSASRERKLAQLQMDFIAGVSHELRTPLSAVKALSENLADGLVHPDAQVRYYGRLLHDQSKGLSEVVEQILRLAGIQSGRAHLDLLPVPVEEVLDRAVEAASSEIEISRCKLERDTEDELPAVLADAASLSHCVRNLLSNAAKYGNNKGWIRLSARRSPEPNSNQVWISVEDHGPGIEPGELRHLFQPFFRGRRAIEDQVHGLGLGLALVKRIVEAHAGNVDVQSVAGEGCRFTLRLPAAQLAE